MAQNIIVITTDLSEQSVDAIRQGLQHAKTTNAEVRVVYACPHFELPLALQRQLNDPESLRKMKETYEQDEQERLGQFLKDHGVQDGSAAIVRFSEENPAKVIVNYAKEVDARLIVMASQGKGAVGRFFLGSNTQKVVASSPCPVLIIPPMREDNE
ncbi:MAG: universal stress protein [Bdellovibrionales bacterium]|nr:universal stress protein [Bdellovibrionales bacterium]